MNSLERWRPRFELLPRKFWDWEAEDPFENFLGRSGFAGERWVPSVETYTKDGSYVVKADLPGVKAKDIHVSVENNRLVIKGERKMDKEIKDRNVRGREIFYGSFQRSVPVPEGLKVDQIKAKYHDGVLEIYAPAGKTLLSKQIKVEAEKHA